MTTSNLDTRDKILVTAEQLIYEHGIQATSMDLLVKCSGVARKSIYRYFATKDDVAAAALAARDERWMTWFCEQTERAATPRLKILEMFDVLSAWFETAGFRGCAFINTCGEVGDPQHPIRLIGKAHKLRLLGYVRELCEQAQLPCPQQMAQHLLILLDGAITVARVAGDYSCAQQAKAMAVMLLDHPTPVC